MASVAVRMGMKSSLALVMAACQGDPPRSILSTWLSMITIELSTIIPKTTISVARETVCSSTPSEVQDPEGDQYGDGDGDGGDGSNAERQQQHGNEDDRHDGDQELMQEIAYRVAHIFRKFGYFRHRDIGWTAVLEILPVLYPHLSRILQCCCPAAFPAKAGSFSFRFA